MRLDQYIVNSGLQQSRERAKREILAGQVLVNGQVVTSPAHKVNGDEIIAFGENVLKYVSRGALKLEKALNVFDVNMRDRVVLDIGSSTGGFTEVSLINGASKVIALDVGTNALHEKLRLDSRVIVMENTDFRKVEASKINDVNLIVTDVSFISLRHIFPKINEVFGDEIEIVALFKPQFECGEKLAKKYKGVIKDKVVHINLLNDFSEYIGALGYKISNVNYSPITGKEGNIEYLFHINGNNEIKPNYSQLVNNAFSSIN